MELVSTPKTLSCSECGEEITATGYLPATKGDAGYEPLADVAVCDACGFNSIGMMGCAPELDEIIEPDPDDILLYVRRTDDGFDVLSTKE